MMPSIIKNKGLISVLRGAAVAAFWLIVWQLLAMAVAQQVLIPARRLVELAAVPAFWLAALRSLGRVVAGFLSAALCGVVLAALTYRIPFLNSLFSPLLSIIKATPVASFIILALVWLDKSHVPVFAAFLMALPIVWSNCMQGLKGVDPGLMEMTRAFAFSPAKRLVTLTVPSVAPYFTAALCSSVGLAWKAGIAAEVLCTPLYSIGKNLYEAKLYLETPDVFAWTVLVIVLSLTIEKLFVKTARFFQRTGGIAK